MLHITSRLLLAVVTDDARTPAKLKIKFSSVLCPSSAARFSHFSYRVSTVTPSYAKVTATTMGKKPASAKPAPDADGISLNATAKFAVLDAPGVTQSAPSSSNGGGKPAADGSAATTGAGLQGRRAKAGAGPRMEGAGADDEAILIGGNSFLERTKMPSWIKVSFVAQVVA